MPDLDALAMDESLDEDFELDLEDALLPKQIAAAYKEMQQKTGQALTMTLHDPAEATKRFRELVDNTLKYQQELQ